MLLTAIIAGNIAKDNGNNLPLMVVLCLAVSVGLSMCVAVFYVIGRIPIVISTIGFTLLYEAVTCLIFNGTGINLVSNTTLRTFSSYPMV